MLRVFQHRVLTKVFWPNRNEVTGSWSKCIMHSFMICVPPQTLFGYHIKKNEMSVAYGRKRREENGVGVT
jgi:hypothetical protein